MPQTAMGEEVTLNRALTVTEEPFLRVCYRLMSFDVLCFTEKCAACVGSAARRHCHVNCKCQGDYPALPTTALFHAETKTKYNVKQSTLIPLNNVLRVPVHQNQHRAPCLQNYKRVSTLET
jgi:hypothetical protein